MFQISRRADYAVRIMLELALRAGKCVPSRQISQRTNVPKAFLHKITADLVKAGLVRTQAGPHGGLCLNHAADQINIQQILEAIEGPICLNICMRRPQECERDLFCPAHDIWGELQTMIVEKMQAATLDILAAEARQLQKWPRQRDHIPYLIHHVDMQVIEEKA
ncbi:MAG: Rrf2 family transcriptional regulator [Chloroflexi bacterium]|nr:Rrf2 family transcriptional regulator [Chloroflexota bacterium]